VSNGNEVPIWVPWLATFAAGMALAAVGTWLKKRERKRRASRQQKEPGSNA